ncbi:hypothetical protein N866_10425 [Actinotalea ferrariae CF5-4]|uniref:Uncharacterized protein n=1 Tax=Actinotalea ferrariae CF5-4 TaxID=948458 RepID=A0A021VM36_9CELL|nr:hypothetical protein [Actinotalea ferrariae]EYR62231.1 hypothetical protein N866_10425 [Actinotalea ferrariae CF5-4]
MGGNRSGPGGDMDATAMPDGPGRCGACGSGALTRLPMVLTDGTDVVFVSCHACERREWFQPTAQGWDALPIDSVLRRATKPR